MSQRTEKPIRRAIKAPKHLTPTEDMVLPEALLKSPHQVVQMQRIVGNRAMNQMIQRKRTTKTLNFAATAMDGVTSLQARIGADDLHVRGTGPTAGQPTRITQVGYPIKTRYVGGHMLNQEFGGLGDADNMIVQSDTSNKGMNKHDNILKRMAIRARQLEEGGSHQQKKYEYYAIENITVNPANPNGAENFAGERHVPESVTVTITPRRRHKGTKVVSAWSTHGETLNNPYTIQNVPPYPAAPGTIKPRRLSPLELRQRKEKKLKKYKGKNAYDLKADVFSLVTSIGPKIAEALELFFKKEQIPLLKLYKEMEEGVYTKEGFNKSNIAYIIHAGLV